MLKIFSRYFIKNKKGNALFLILIAVALFAALSYAITQSGRGSGNISRETNEIDFAKVQQIISLYQTTIQRMVLGGIPIINLRSDAANTNCTDNYCRIYHTSGGSITEQSFQGNTAKMRLMSYNAGTSLLDIVMYLPVSQSFCLYFNQRLGITGNVDASSSAISAADMSSAVYSITGISTIAGTHATHMSGFEQGCYSNTNASNPGAAGYKIVSLLLAR